MDAGQRARNTSRAIPAGQVSKELAVGTNTMKDTRTAVAVLVALLGAVVVVSFLYGVPAGRSARRETVRAVRLARNATGIAPIPVVTIRLWNSASQRAALIEVYESGRVVAVRRGERIERTLPPQPTSIFIEQAGEALGGFNTGDCGAVPGTEGFNAELHLLVRGLRFGSLCRDASRWPDSVESRRLFSTIERHLPGMLPFR